MPQTKHSHYFLDYSIYLFYMQIFVLILIVLTVLKLLGFGGFAGVGLFSGNFLNYKIVVNFCKITAEWFLQGEGLIFPVSPAVPKDFLQKGFSVLMKEEK